MWEPTLLVMFFKSKKKLKGSSIGSPKMREIKMTQKKRKYDANKIKSISVDMEVKSWWTWLGTNNGKKWLKAINPNWNYRSDLINYTLRVWMGRSIQPQSRIDFLETIRAQLKKDSMDTMRHNADIRDFLNEEIEKIKGKNKTTLGLLNRPHTD